MTRVPQFFLLLCTAFAGFCVAEQRTFMPSIETDGKALIMLKKMIKNDPDGVLVGWQLINGTCSWYGVICSHGRVSQLDLSYQDFEGIISFEHFAIMDKLMVLKLSAMGLAFSINSTSLILLPSSLKALDLSLTTLVGPLPYNLFSKCRNLEIFNLSFSNLTGFLPNIFPMNASKLQVLKLSHNHLSGSLSNLRIENPCNSLLQFDLAWNHFSDSLPTALSKCTYLKDLNLGNNKFSGEIPTSFNQFINMQKIDLSYNHLTGRIPYQFGNICSSLQELILSHNNILGSIPLTFRSCTFLKVFDLSNNDISAPFPSSLLQNLSSLEKLLLSKNMISGAFPSSIKYCQKLRVVDFGSNNLNGVIHTDICPGAISLEELMFPDNYITGELSPQISNCSQLTKIDFSLNNMSGLIPMEFGVLKNLKQLIGWSSGLEGSIPSELGKCRKLHRLVLNNNRLNGKIPTELRNCSNLEWISLTSNELSGAIPGEFGQLTKLSILQLGHNSLSGEIPQELAQCSSLLWLDLSNNKLIGDIPSRLGRQMSAKTSPAILPANTFVFIGDGRAACDVGGLSDVAGVRSQRLRQVLRLEDCNISKRYSGVFVSMLIGYETIEYLDLSHNQLVGEIPDEFGDAVGLQVLDVSYNQLSSEIPASLGRLNNLIVFEAAHNRLQGEIPYSLSNLSSLWQIDLSYNQLTGEIPQKGQLITVPASQYAHNFGLCGLPLPKCKDNSQVANAGEKTSTALGIKKIIIGTLISFFFAYILIFCTVAICFRRKKEERVKMLSCLQSSQAATTWNFNKEKEPLSINVATFEKQLKKLKLSQLIEATNNFSTTNLIGRGGYGEVFKATLNDGSKVAIEKLMGLSNQGDRDFKAEMETSGKIQHRNLVPLLGYCKVGGEMLLVYEFMEHGSLEDMLHRKAEAQNHQVLRWEERKKIALGAAKGLRFLHHDCIPHIIHCDMKSSNILLDNEMEARVSDFGLARLINALDTHVTASTPAGTPGYVPPEFYAKFRFTTKGDVYSLGVIFLELLTGKCATNEEDFGDTNLVGWAKMKVRDGKQMEVIDPDLLIQATNEAGDKKVEEMTSFLEIALQCVEDLPSQRPNMFHVVTMLRELRPPTIQTKDRASLYCYSRNDY